MTYLYQVITDINDFHVFGYHDHLMLYNLLDFRLCHRGRDRIVFVDTLDNLIIGDQIQGVIWRYFLIIFFP